MLHEKAVRHLSVWLYNRGMKRDAPALATGILTLVGCFVAFVTSLLVRPFVGVAAYVQLIMCLWIFEDTTDHIFLLWLSYGYVYSVAGVGQDENPIILGVSTLVHLGGIAISILARKRFEDEDRGWIWLMGCILLLPVRCNNLFYEPGIAVARIAAFAVIGTLERDAPWFLRQYPLFCKVELVPFVAIAHLVARRFVDSRTVDHLSLLPVTSPQPPPTGDIFDENDNDGDVFTQQLTASLAAMDTKKGE